MCFILNISRIKNLSFYDFDIGFKTEGSCGRFFDSGGVLCLRLVIDIEMLTLYLKVLVL